jgi:MFS transporter, DHA1 family, solute carrier family 18 (vesicular amine transporter), member 1/2
VHQVSGVVETYHRLLRREVVDICLFIFMADVVTGVQTPIFPLYATSLGSSLGLLGLITAALGLTRLAGALPVGMLSDRLDRKTVLVGGMAMFALSFAVYSITPSAGWLVVPRLLQAVAMVATFPLGIAYIGDVVEVRDRGAAIGIYTAAMGSGFAVGPLIGSWVGSMAGYPAAYLSGAVIAVFGTAFGAFRLVRARGSSTVTLSPRRFNSTAVMALLRRPPMLMACVANIAITLSMSGAIFTYFPVYARGVGLSTVTIGSIFAWRSLASATGRLPMGPLSSRLPAYWTIACVLVVEGGVNLAIAHATSPIALTALLVVEGVGVGVFLVSAQSTVAATAAPHNRGTAVGLFWMAGSVGELFGPIGLGLIAQLAGLISVFESVAAVVWVGALAVGGLGVYAASRRAREPAPAT